jgi:hypothetical protein
MKLNEALKIKKLYIPKKEIIKINQDGYISLTDLSSFFFDKNVKKWMNMKNTIYFVNLVSNLLKKKSIATKRGKYNGGTYAHAIIAIEFCAWLSPELRVQLISDYIMTGKKCDIIDILKKNGYKLIVID